MISSIFTLQNKVVSNKIHQPGIPIDIFVLAFIGVYELRSDGSNERFGATPWKGECSWSHVLLGA
jgi:hypothetical protein